MTIETKFKPGDNIWIIHETYSEYASTGIKCSFCNGTGYVGKFRCLAARRVGGHTSKCVDGVIRKFRFQYSVKECAIEEIDIIVDVNGTNIEYTSESGNIYDESELYATEEEAKAECDRRNTECNSLQQ